MIKPSEQRLTDWRETLSPVLDRLRDFDLPGDFPFDFSPESLEPLERVLLERYPAGDAPSGNADFVEGVVGYLGETLMRIGGGSWAWDDDAELPLIAPDPELDLDVVSPLACVMDALRARTGREFQRPAAALRSAVDERRRELPDWQPTKEHTSGVDVVDVTELPQDPWLVSWLGERQAAFGRWVAEYAGDAAGWDFSPDSLDLLERALLARIAAVAEFADPANDDFLQGAAWYFGEVARRHGGAMWSYTPLRPEADDWLHSSANPWAGRPYVRQNGPDGNASVPLADLRATVRSGARGMLRKRLNPFRA